MQIMQYIMLKVKFCIMKRHNAMETKRIVAMATRALVVI